MMRSDGLLMDIDASAIEVINTIHNPRCAARGTSTIPPKKDAAIHENTHLIPAVDSTTPD
jgi:hypothetical protein